jgi:hypothetical protein
LAVSFGLANERSAGILDKSNLSNAVRYRSGEGKDPPAGLIGQFGTGKVGMKKDRDMGVSVRTVANDQAQ